MTIHRSIKCHTLHKRLRLVNLSSLYNDIFFKYVQNSPFTWQLWLILCNCFGEFFFSCYNNETRQVVLRFFSTLLNDFPQFGIKDHIDNKWNLHASDCTMLPPKCEQHCQPCEVAQTMSRKKSSPDTRFYRNGLVMDRVSHTQLSFWRQNIVYPGRESRRICHFVPLGILFC